jgi:hypothetical protein
LYHVSPLDWIPKLNVSGGGVGLVCAWESRMVLLA